MKVIFKIIFFCCWFVASPEATWAQLQPQPTISSEADIANVDKPTTIISEQYANGSPKLWKTLVDGKAEGLWLEWYPDGTLRYKAYWKNNLGHGKWEYFHPNGQLRSESFYLEDIGQGIERSYFNNGQLQSDATYANGKKIGEELIYDVNGTLLKRNFYDDGQIVTDQPALFEPGNITDLKSNEWGICFTPDGNTAYFTRRDGATNRKRIYETTKTKSGWSVPSIASFSTDEDEAPFVNHKGDKLFFASFRPLPDGSSTQKFDSNLWYVNKTSDGWSEPQPVSGSINQAMQENNQWPANYEAGPSTDKDGNLYYWAKATQINVTNLYFCPFNADGTFGDPVELMEPSSNKYYDTAPVLSPDGKLLFFSSDNRDDALGGSDIYYAKRVNGAWSKPKNLAPFLVNTYGNEGSPSFSPDGKYFFFSSTRAGNKDADGENLWDLYYLETKFLIIE